MFSIQLPSYWRRVVYPLSLGWIVWLFGVSNVFTMGYHTPFPGKVALTAVTLLIPVTLVLSRTLDGIAAALLFSILTWIPVGLLWSLDRGW